MIEKPLPEPEKIIKRIAWYARVSTIEQWNNFSTEWQINHIHNYIKMREQAQLVSVNYQTWPVEIWDSEKVRIFEDTESWASNTRAGLLELTDAVKNGEIDILIVWKIDRLYRNVKSMLEFVSVLDAYWVVLISLCEPIDGTPAGKFFLTLMGAFAEMERNNIRDRWINWKNTKAGHGYFVGWNYSPYWYDFEHDGRWKKIIINEEQAVIVREIFDLYTNQNISSSEIAKKLNERGIATKFNLEWKKAVEKDRTNLKALKKAQKNFWHRSSVDKILRNELYAGRYYYWKLRSENLITSYADWRVKRKIKRVPNPKQSHVPFDCPAIIDRELYERTLYELKKRQKITTKTPHLFTWLIECWLCGKRYGWYINRQWNVCYRCNGKNKHKVPLNEICQFSSEVSEKWLFSKVWKVSDLILLNPDKFLNEYFKKRPTKNKNSMIDIEARIKLDNDKLIKLKEELNTYMKALANAEHWNDASLAKYVDYYRKMVEETDEKMVNLLKSLEASRNQHKNLLNISRQSETLHTLSSLYKEKYKALKQEERNFIATKLVKSIKLFPDKAILEICVYHQTVGDTEPSDEDRCHPALQKQLLGQEATKKLNL